MQRFDEVTAASTAVDRQKVCKNARFMGGDGVNPSRFIISASFGAMLCVRLQPYVPLPALPVVVAGDR